jgi:hypothetical protein
MLGWTQAQQGAGSSMAEHGVRARCEYGRDPMPFPRQASMAYCEDAVVQRMKPSEHKPVVDFMAGDAGIEELPPRSDPMLAIGERRDHPIDATRLGFARHIRANPRSVGHGRQFRRLGRPQVRGSCRT